MKCPICNVDLQMSERQGVEIDYCPQCRGIWLDRGELDKIIEKSSIYNQTISEQRMPEMPMDRGDNHQDRYENHDDRSFGYGYGHGGKRKKEGFLGELFDF